MKRAGYLVLIILAVTWFAGMAANAAGQYDLGGETVSFVNISLKGFMEGGLYEGRLEEAEELFNCKIESVTGLVWDQVAESLMTRLLAGTSTYDVWYMTNRAYWQLIPQNAMLPVSEVLSPDYYDGVATLCASIADATAYKGKTYTFGNANSVRNLQFVLWNKQIFEEEGLENPYDLVRSGEWTWEKYEEIAKKITKDTDGDGQIDRWGTYQSSPLYFAWTNGVGPTRASEDGGREFTFDDPRALEAMRVLHRWETVDKIVGGPETREMLDDGVIAMQPTGIWAGTSFYPEFDYGVVPLPKGPAHDRYVYPSEAITMFALPANSKAPEALIALTDFLFRAEEIEERVDEQISAIARDADAYEMIWDGWNNWSGEVFMLDFVLGPAWSGDQPLPVAINAVLSGEKDAAQAMAEVRPAVQAVLDELYK